MLWGEWSVLMKQCSDLEYPHAGASESGAQTDRAELLTAIEKGEEAIKEGRMLSHEEARERMSRWLRDESLGEA